MTRGQIPPVVAGVGTALTTAAGHETVRALWLQFAAVLVAIAALWSYLAFGPLSRAERAVLAPVSLGRLMLEHLGLTVTAAAIVLVVTLPLGLALTRGPLRRLARPVLAATGIGEGAPAIGLMALLACLLGFGVRTAVAGLAACAVFPVLRAFMTGLQGVRARDAADAPETEADPGAPRRGVALLALAVLLPGVRTAFVLVVGAAALAAFTGGGGLGVLITTGVEHHQRPVALVGAGLVTLLAVVVDWVGRFVEVLVRRREPPPVASA
ncbi:ABC transporter permease [Kocuria tytonicola]|uniref:ABC transporter permease n=1 Tax=Kocuria tytonicola TaxID=2055946 RepID=UPI001F0C6AC9|nr:ABC transporter permease [Kocuria tytonicola]